MLKMFDLIFEKMLYSGETLKMLKFSGKMFDSIFEKNA